MASSPAGERAMPGSPAIDLLSATIDRPVAKWIVRVLYYRRSTVVVEAELVAALKVKFDGLKKPLPPLSVICEDIKWLRDEKIIAKGELLRLTVSGLELAQDIVP